MKSLIKLCFISIIPLSLLSLVVPTVVLVSSQVVIYHYNWFLFCMFLLAICLSIVCATVFTLTKYYKVFDNVDLHLNNLQEKQDKLNLLIEQYQNLITNKN